MASNDDVIKSIGEAVKLLLERQAAVVEEKPKTDGDSSWKFSKSMIGMEKEKQFNGAEAEFDEWKTKICARLQQYDSRAIAWLDDAAAQLDTVIGKEGIAKGFSDQLNLSLLTCTAVIAHTMVRHHRT